MTREGRARQRVPRAIRLGAALLLAAAAAAGCGLPDSFYLDPPSGTVAGLLDGRFTFMHPGTTDANFRGYEIYYKLYADYTLIGADANLAGSTYSTADLTSHGFQLFCRGQNISAPSASDPTIMAQISQNAAQDTSVANRSVPLIAILSGDRASSFAITVTLNPSSSSTSDNSYGYTASSGTYAQEIDRSVNAAPPPYCKPFTYNHGYYVSSDPDIASIWSTLNQQVLYMAAYVVSYGLQNLSTKIYSYPVYLGYLQLSGFSP